MAAIIFLLYLGSVGGALAFATQWGKAKPSWLQGYVYSVLIASVTIIILYFWLLASTPRFASDVLQSLLICLFFPSLASAVMVIIYELFHYQPAPKKIRWFGAAILSLLLLVFSPIVEMLLPYRGTSILSNWIENFDFNVVLGFVYLVIVLLALAFVPISSYQPTGRYVLWGSAGALALGTVWYSQALANNNAGAVIIYPILGSVPIGIIAFLTLHDLALRHRQRLLPAGLAVTVSLSLVWSPYLGSIGVFEICNAIHRWQLEPVVAGLQNYNRDSARYPLEVKALMPFYLPSAPHLFCMNEGATSYYIEQCEEGAMLLLRDPNPNDYSRLRFDLGRNIGWRYLEDNLAACTRFRP